LHEASAKVFAEMKKGEESAGKAGTEKLTMEEVRNREILKGYHQLPAILVVVCLVAVAIGLVQALYRMFLSPSVPKGEDEVCLPRQMLVVLVWQLFALCSAAGLVQFWFKLK